MFIAVCDSTTLLGSNSGIRSNIAGIDVPLFEPSLRRMACWL